jgi:hypothetical protein
VLLTEYLRCPPGDVPDLETILTGHLHQVGVPEELNLPEPAPARPAAGAVASGSEADTEIDRFVRNLEGPLAAISIERAPGSRPAPQPPGLANVFGWSALATAPIAFVPPLRTVAGLAAIGLGLLSWLMPGQRWLRARLAAALAVLLALAGVVVGPRVHVAARLQEDLSSPPLELARLDEPPAVLPAAAETAIAAGTIPEPVGISASTTRAPLPDQGVPQPLTEPAKVPVVSISHRWKAHAETVSSVELSSDQRHLVTASTDRSMMLWETAGPRLAFAHTNLAEPLLALTALDHSALIVSLDAMHQMQWWSLDGGIPLKSAALDPDSLIPPTISPNGRILAVGGQERRQLILHLDGDQPVRQTLAGFTSWVKLVRFSPDSVLLAIVCHDDSISLRQAGTGTLLHSFNFADASISTLEFSDNATHLVALGEQGRLRVWNCSTGALITEGQLPASRPHAIWLTGGRSGQLIAASGSRRLAGVRSGMAGRLSRHFDDRPRGRAGLHHRPSIR